ncbi:MAG TPA: UDP-3-O-(3-hydroxymyristoyl)glucosamine N-acyltransferase [Bacteroidia bacterium]|jgi:UDP-3-O-[3-hydroxymyristoyl] glucosamine N-acyltransferase
MKLDPPRSLKELASIINAEYTGDKDHRVSGINEINKVEKGDLVFVDHPKYYDKALNSAATTIIINKKVECPSGKALIISDDPFRDYNKLVSHFYRESFSAKHISDKAIIGEDTILHPGVYIADNVHIGKNCLIYPNVVIYDNCVIGDNVIIHANTVLGGHGFYYKKRADRFDKMISCGRLVIEDDVEIGGGCTIDKGVSGDTVIGRGSKLDNQVHIGHDTTIGKMCLIAGQVGIAGACVIEDGVTLWGQVGIPSKIHVGRNAVFLGQSAPAKSVEGGKTYLGSPSGEAREKMREMFYLQRLHELFEKKKD